MSCQQVFSHSWQWNRDSMAKLSTSEHRSIIRRERLFSRLIVARQASAHVYARRRKQYCKLHYCLWKISMKPNSHFLIHSVFFVSKGNLFFYIYFTTLQLVLVPCGGGRICLPVHHHSADYISLPLGSLGPLCYICKWSSAHVYTRGRNQYCKFHYCLWRISIKPGLPFSYP